MASRLHKILALGTCFQIFLLAACQDKGPQPGAPAPGKEKKPQIYYLEDAAVAKPWWSPDADSLREQLNARFDRVVVHDAKEAEEQLRQWNARPIDILILGAGLPQKLWTTLQLPRAPGRQVLALGENANPLWQNVYVSAAETEKFLHALCAQGFQPAGCRVYPENILPKIAPGTFAAGPHLVSLGTMARERSPTGEVVELNLVAKWDLFLATLLTPHSTRTFKTQALSFSSVFLQAMPAKSTPQLKDFLVKWSLEALSAKGSTP